MQNCPTRAWRSIRARSISGSADPAFEKVRHVGEGLAVIVAENRYIAEDAAELIEVDLER